MGRLYVRTANSGSDPDVLVDDLGYTVETGVSWKELSSTVSGIPLEGNGQFTSVELRDSRDLYDKIIGGSLEWSTDGSTMLAGSNYDPNYMLIEDIYSSFLEADNVATQLDKLVDESGTYTYVGEAAPGTLTSAASWRIYRLDESLAGDEELIKRYAEGDAGFVHIWNNRASLSY